MRLPHRSAVIAIVFCAAMSPAAASNPEEEAAAAAARAAVPAPAASASAGPAAAECWIGYAEYEAQIKHLDLAACPDAPKDDAHFCRLRLEGDAATVDKFALSDNCLVATQSLPLAAFLERYGPRLPR